MIIFENVDKFILSNINLHIPEGEVVGIVGLSGAGKTTLLKLACGLLQPDSGMVYVKRKKPVGNISQKKQISAFFAGVPFLCRKDTLRENLEVLKCSYQIPNAQFSEDCRKLAKELRFEEFMEKRIYELSLGQRMRAELGAALIVRPEILFLDEPAIGLDANGKAAFRDILSEHISSGMTVLITSHDMVEISRMCSRIVVLNKGELLYYGSEKRLQGFFTQIHSLRLKVSGKYPDFQDLPITSYIQDGDMFILNYNAEYITSAEILHLILSQTNIEEVKVCKPNLESIITNLEKGRGDKRE